MLKIFEKRLKMKPVVSDYYTLVNVSKSLFIVVVRGMKIEKFS